MNNISSFSNNIDLKKYCTLGIGGPAKFFCEVKTISQMEYALNFCFKEGLTFMVLGKGSNCLFDDQGFNGCVILNKINFCEQPTPGVFYVGAGYSFSLLGVQSSRQGFGGLEFAAGIPASVGGAIFMNAGANGCETSTYLKSVEYIGIDGQKTTIDREDLRFSYRFSPFQQKKGAIVAATFCLPKEPSARIKQIEIVNKRKNTQPYESKSAGCIFLNLPHEAAGAVIDRCGLKLVSVGGAEVSPKHANFLVNHHQATCEDMLSLINLVKVNVKKQTGIDLQEELRHIPYHQE